MNDYIIPQSWLDATDQEKKDYANGCGGGWKSKPHLYQRIFYKFLNKAIPDTIWGLNITEICNWHDFDFTFLEKTEENFIQANKDFYHNLKKKINDESVWFLRKVRLKRAKKMDFLVNLLGREWFFV
jgi:hypothetical protein